MIISRVMTKNPVYVHPDASVTDVRSLMDKEKVSHIPVLDKNNTLVGIVTKLDLLKAGPSEATSLDMYEISYLLTKIKASEIMIKKVVTVNEDEVLEEAARIMADKGIGCLPVMRGSLLVGIITDTDLFHAFINAFGARHKGVRVIVNMGEHPGQIAKVAGAIAEKNGNIVSLVTAEGDDVAHRRATIKVEGLSRSEMETIIKNLPDMVLEDIRE
ncbi:MAG: CBS and ACT domain-containing protein [Treponema sp.]|jgi:acetoin utilization protein AcuB|nr:CBS and ACT domain-containing protein [Treponema sp.]